LALTAYDLDGTIIISPFKNVQLRKFFWRMNPSINKSDVEYIITARTSQWKIVTWLTCKICGLHNIKKIIFNPVDRWDIEYVSNWKCRCLMDHNFDAYVDNNCALLDAIRANGFKGELRNV